MRKQRAEGKTWLLANFNIILRSEPFLAYQRSRTKAII